MSTSRQDNLKASMERFQRGELFTTLGIELQSTLAADLKLLT
jgi:hypothetical protein